MLGLSCHALLLVDNKTVFIHFCALMALPRNTKTKFVLSGKLPVSLGLGLQFMGRQG